MDIFCHGSVKEVIKQFDFSAASPWTHGIRGRSHNDITDVTDGRTDGKDDP